MSNKTIHLPDQHKKGIIRLHNVAKRYGDSTAVDALCLEVLNGETVALVGASGCGKTTTLRLIAGLEIPDWGEIWINNRLVSSPDKLTPPHTRRIGMVFQDLALWPHMTVFQHVEFSLPKGLAKEERKYTVNDILSMVQLTEPKKYPRQLSGGEQQRLAIARALANKPDILLMDEPFSSLDTELRHELQQYIKALVTELDITMLYVTHQQEEAVFMADRIATIKDGKISQCIPTHKFPAQKVHQVEEADIEISTQKIIHLEATSKF